MSNTNLHTDKHTFSHKKAGGLDQLTLEDFFANPHDLLPAAWTASAMSDWQKKYETAHGRPMAWHHYEAHRLPASKQVFVAGGFPFIETDPDHSSCIQLICELPNAALPEAAKMLMELRDHYSSLAEPLAPPALPAPSVNHTLSSLPDACYKLIEPIPVHIEQQSDDSWTASFEEANISMSGTSLEDAKQALADDIGYALDLLLSERDILSPVLQHQLAVLEQYVRRDSQ